jgi:hypothetical protein
MADQSQEGVRHTPGSWRYAPEISFSDSDNPCVVDEFDLVVAEVSDDGHDEDECEANAHLIAAAPDLLAALKALQIQAMQSPDLLRTVWGQEALERASAAIARASGEA